jgi:hypothetical protein
MPSLRNFKPIPGARGWEPVSEGSAAEESLTIPWLAPLKIPVKGWDPELTNLTFPTVPTEWMYLVLYPQVAPGIASPGESNDCDIPSVKIRATLGQGA